MLANTSIAAIAGGTVAPASSAAGVAACTSATCVSAGAAQAQFELLWTAAESDLADGMERSLDMYQTGSAVFVNGHTILNAVVFVAFVLSLAGIQFLFFRPYAVRISAESHRAAALLRNLPDDIDLARLRGGAHAAMPPIPHASTPAGGAAKGSGGSLAGKGDD